MSIDIRKIYNDETHEKNSILKKRKLSEAYICEPK